MSEITTDKEFLDAFEDNLAKDDSEHIQRADLIRLLRLAGLDSDADVWETHPLMVVSINYHREYIQILRIAKERLP